MDDRDTSCPLYVSIVVDNSSESNDSESVLTISGTSDMECFLSVKLTVEGCLMCCGVPVALEGLSAIEAFLFLKAKLPIVWAIFDTFSFPVIILGTCQVTSYIYYLVFLSNSFKM